jgi:urate oxidase
MLYIIGTKILGDPVMNTFTSITYSHSKQNDSDEIRKVEYKSTVEENGQLMSTSYNNIMKNDSISESFNKLLKRDYDVYEQVGNSQNKNDWQVKEFHNNSLNKEYKDPYAKHNFDNCLNIEGPSSAKPIGNDSQNQLLLNF